MRQTTFPQSGKSRLQIVPAAAKLGDIEVVSRDPSQAPKNCDGNQLGQPNALARLVNLADMVMPRPSFLMPLSTFPIPISRFVIRHSLLIALLTSVALMTNPAVAQSLEDEPKTVSPTRTTGSIERLDPALDSLVDSHAKIEVLSEGHLWSEGPVWIKDSAYLLFSDIPRNSIYKWKDGEGLSLFLRPSGYTGDKRKGGKAGDFVDELGSNGLTLDADGNLILCQHGDRRVARLSGPFSSLTPGDANFESIAHRWEGKRFNSPNDVVIHSSGAIYFTDPPYGLEKGGDASTREIDFNGVYRSAPDGKVTLVTKVMTKPNGLAFSPDERILYIGQSDSSAPLWRAFPVNDDGSVGEPRVFFDASAIAKTGKAGGPDGFKVDEHGNLFATGPGGVLVLSPEGTHLGTIVTGDLVANCAWGDDGHTLYMTSNHQLCRIKLKTSGKCPCE
jgi:gluconolactonase